MSGFKKVLFIDPLYPRSFYHKGRNIAPSMGIGYLSQALEDAGIESKVFDCSFGYTTDDLRKMVEDFKPDLVSFSLMTFQYKHHYAFIEKAKQILPPKVKILVGGPHVTSWKEKILNECHAIDFAAISEGEETLVELCCGDNLAKIKSLIYRVDGKIIANEERALPDDLDKISFPRYRAFELEKYEDIVHICSSRGCPFGCIFCQFRNTSARKWRARSAENVMQEISFWYEKGYRKFSFIDDNFTLNKDRTIKICNYISDNGFKNLYLSAVGIRADKVDFDLLKKMKEVGFRAISIGVESANMKILEIVKKGEKIEEIERAIKWATELSFSVKLYFIVGSPGETLDDVKKSIEFARKYSVSGVNFSNLIPFPDSELFDIIEKTGKFLEKPEDYLNSINEFDRIPLYEIFGMTTDERKEALKLTSEAAESINKKMRIVDEKLINILACPICKSGIKYDPAKDEILCLKCEKIYKIENNVPVMLKENTNNV